MKKYFLCFINPICTSLLFLLIVMVAHCDDGKRKPNIIMIMADDMGYETLGCYGGTTYKTPVLDRLAETGMLFEHAYAQPLCTNSRLQMMTGKYNHRNWVAFGILDPNEYTFGHMMSKAGYATCIAGKWQLQSYDPPDYPGNRRGIGMHPKDSGFDEYCLWHTGHTEDKGSRYADPVILENGEFLQNMKGKYGPDVWTSYITDYMERNKENPFFIYFPMALPHDPFVPTPDSPEWSDPEKRQQSNDRFFIDMVEYTDKMVGRIVSKADELGIRENTLILFFGDNGTHQKIYSKLGNNTIQGGKGLTTDGGTRVPLVANWLGTTPKGKVVDDLIDSTDFFATFAEIAEAELPENYMMDGQSFYSQLLGKVGKPREWTFCHYDPRPGWDKDQFTLHRYARNQKYKLYDTGKFYDISNDVLEQNPIPISELNDDELHIRNELQKVLDSMKN